MQRVIMKKTKEGSPDGREVFTYQEGQEYDLTDELYEGFKRLGAVESITVIPSKNTDKKIDETELFDFKPETETAHIKDVKELHEKKKNSKKGVK